MLKCRLSRSRVVAAIILASAWLLPTAGWAGVAIICNRTEEKVDFVIGRPDGRETRHAIEAGDLTPIPFEGKLGIQYGSQGEPRRLLLRKNSIYSFVSEKGKLELIELVLKAPEQEKVSAANDNPPDEQATKRSAVYTVTVKLLTDDDEPAVQRLWEERLRARLSAVSAITERYCRVRFEVVAIGTWESNDETDDFAELLQEFEKNVDPAPAQLAIGFSGQYRRMRGQTHMGGIRGPLHSHILIREWSQHLSTSDQEEILLHELGHFLGASHNSEGNSVMRPLHGDHRANARDFRIGFDPLNTLVMYLLGEELHSGNYRGFSGMHPSRKQRLRLAYSIMADAIPKDPTAGRYLKYLDPPTKPTSHADPEPSAEHAPLVDGVGAVLLAITDAARRNHGLKLHAEGQTRLSGDRLSEYYVRTAAKAAEKLPPKVAEKAFLLALGVAVDRQATLREMPILGGFYKGAESQEQFRQRFAVLGFPTLRRRRDLAQHFFISCALTVIVGGRKTESIGLLKEIKDSRGGSGFSFADLTADMAGATFAAGLRGDKLSLTDVSRSFSVERFMPEIDSLEEGIAWKDFAETYGLASDNQLQRKRLEIRRQILSLPGYAGDSTQPAPEH